MAPVKPSGIDNPGTTGFPQKYNEEPSQPQAFDPQATGQPTPAKPAPAKKSKAKK